MFSTARRPMDHCNSPSGLVPLSTDCSNPRQLPNTPPLFHPKVLPALNLGTAARAQLESQLRRSSSILPLHPPFIFPPLRSGVFETFFPRLSSVSCCSVFLFPCRVLSVGLIGLQVFDFVERPRRPPRTDSLAWHDLLPVFLAADLLHSPCLLSFPFDLFLPGAKPAMYF